MKIKTILFTSLLGLMASGASAESSAWVGEPMDYGHSYYLLDANRIKKASEQQTAVAFLSYYKQDENTYYPVYSTYADASYFSAFKGNEIKVGLVSTGNYCMRLLNYDLSHFTGNNYYLYTDGTGQKAYSKTYRDFEKEYTNENDFIFNIWMHSGSHYYSLDGIQSENSKDYLTFVDYSNSNKVPKKWKFISPEQYIGRPKLDAIIATVEKEYGTILSNIPESIREAYTSAKNAQIYKPGDGEIGTLGNMIYSSYSSLTNAYINVKYGEEFSSPYSSLMSIINMTEKIVNSLRSEGFAYSSDLDQKLQNAKSVLNTANADPSTEGIVTAMQDATTNLSAAVAPYSSASFLYCRDMKNLAESLGYVYPDDDKQILMDIVSGVDTRDLNTFIKDSQAKFKQWVNDQISAGDGFPAGSDFSAFILNNSFEMGNYSFWTQGGSAKTAEVKKSNGNYVFSAEGEDPLFSSQKTVTLTSNEISSLPEGIYSLTATTTGDPTVTVKVGGTEVADISSFNVNKGENVTIEVSGKSFTVDEFKLTLVGGAATESFQKISISSVGYASCVAKYNLDFNGLEDIHAYAVVPDVQNSVVHLLPLNQVTKGTAFIVAGSTANVSACITASDDNLSQNKFEASESAVSPSTFANTSIYYLGVSEGVAVFKKLTSGSLVAGKGFFRIEASQASMFRITMEEQNETSVDVLPAIESTSQIIYSISGQKQNKIGSNGLYIVNGKKVWINK